MRRDRELLQACEAPPADDPAAGLPALRLYSWQPWTVSLGNAQVPEQALDLAELARRGYGWVKRPTGGRAVLHAEEITYAVVAPMAGPFAGGLAETHRRIAQALARFYTDLGLAVDLTRPAPAAELDPRLPAPCFLAPGLAELAVAGRKIAGSAQRRGRSAFLQHGSLPLGSGHLELAELIPGEASARRRLRDRLAKQATCLGDLVSPLPPREELERALVAAFAAEFSLRWIP